MNQYLDLLRDIYENGVTKDDRTGTGTKSIFGAQLRFDLSKGFPAVTTKRLYFKSLKVELAWFLKGGTNLDYLKEHGVGIWDGWADDEGDLGPVYGFQWRNFGARYEGPEGSTNQVVERYEMENATIQTDKVVTYKDKGLDQIRGVVDALKNNPKSRRHIVTAWNPVQVDEMVLPPCHLLFQFNARPMTLEERKENFEGALFDSGFTTLEEKLDGAGAPRFWLDCQMYQRSADMFLGVPFNIASYALLTHIVAREVNMIPGHFIHTLGDAHIYLNHFEQVELQLGRDTHELPSLKLDKACTGIDNFDPDHASLENYEHHPAISAPIAV